MLPIRDTQLVSEVLLRKTANAFVSDAEVTPEVGSIHRGEVGRQTDEFRRKAGGLWVGGRMTLTPTELIFTPNAVNRAIQTGSLNVSIELSQISAVDVSSGVLTKIVDVRAGDRLFRFRCFGAPAVAQAIRSAMGASGR